ncbi:glycoside hydrolase family 2 protein [Cohnella caldifontis]|uniref:glycoside hydrolase family 2 protein n=1 Tax=Cohnella caldifontis TaxID=3027471 RepID=UPI0023EBB085|nr:sugar-binding domain-containing protein [Cohnella sp. YIM B05605]
MNGRISLNGSDWLFKDFVGEDWVWRDAEKPDSKDVRWWRKGTVPGTVLHDVWQNGETPDPYFERNSLLAEWVPERTWVYKKWFPVDEKLRGQRIRLHFEGVDYAARFFLNGKQLGTHEGMYTPAVFEVGGELRYGEDNLLAVVIEKAPDEQPQVSQTRYVRTHKSRMTYWWDFCPRMIHQGIWDDVYLEVTGPVLLEDVYVRPQLSDDARAAYVSVSSALASDRAAVVEANVALSLDGRTVASAQSRHAVAAGETRLNAMIELPDPQLWWPNGSGEQPLYEARLTVTEVGGTSPSAEREVKFGIREVRFERNDTPDDGAKPYKLVVNGEPTFIKGWNWVPIDVMYGVPRPEKLERLLQLARRAGVNLLRIWGGGLIEKEAFYDLCDRYGILVWQEFIQSSSGIANKPSTDPEFLELMAREAEAIVPRKRNHPSLAIWCGGNELQADDGSPLDDDEPVLAVLKDAVRRLHPGALWLPTSPSGRLFMNSLENIENDPTGMHDVHGPWEHQGLTAHYTLYNRGTSLLHSEFGVEGMTNLKALNATISAPNQWPAGKDNPVYFHRGSWWNNEQLVQESFGGEIKDVLTMVRASQFLQAAGLGYALEANRRRKWQSSGTLPWQFNEPFPNAWCTSALDYYANPKAVYYSVARAYRETAITARFDRMAWAGHERFTAELWTVSSSKLPLEGIVASWRLAGASGTAYGEGSGGVTIPSRKPVQVGSIEAALDGMRDDVFFLSLELTDASGRLLADNRYTFSRSADMRPMFALPQTEVRVTKRDREGDGWLLELSNPGGSAALQVRLEDARPLGAGGYAYFSDNDFTLLPGERRAIEVDWSGVAAGERKLELSGWNFETITMG